MQKGWGLVTLQAFIIFNWILLMITIAFIVESVSKRLATLIVWTCQQYFEAKKKYLVDLSQLDVPDEDDLWKRKRN